jgi:hypothetical protein
LTARNALLGFYVKSLSGSQAQFETRPIVGARRHCGFAPLDPFIGPNT